MHCCYNTADLKHSQTHMPIYFTNCSNNIVNPDTAHSGCVATGPKFSSISTKASQSSGPKLLNELAASEEFLQRRRLHMKTPQRSSVWSTVAERPTALPIKWELPVKCSASFKSLNTCHADCVTLSLEYVCFSERCLISLQYLSFHAWLMKSIQFINVFNKV